MNKVAKDRILRVLAMVPAPPDETPGQRFRIEQWAPFLDRDGIEVVFSSFADMELIRALQRPGRLAYKIAHVLKAWSRRIQESSRVEGFDLAYIFREGALIGPAIAERILVSRGIPLIFDFDDAVWIRYTSPSNTFFSHLRCPGKTSALCRIASSVMAGNAYLRDYALQRNDCVTIVPTTIDTDLYRPLNRATKGIPAIGWTGSFSTERHLEVARSALERLRERVEYRMVIVGGGRFQLRGVEVEHRAWRSGTETRDLSDIDVGIMPLPDIPWERGKCGLKALQCMALAIPVVVSPVGVNREIVKHGINGFLAETGEEWTGALERLIKESSLRRKLGANARSTVEKEFSAEVHAPRVADIFRKAVS